MQLQHYLVLAAILGYCSGFVIPQSDGSLTVVSPNQKFSTDQITVNGNNLYTSLTSASSYSSFVRPLYLSNFDSLIYQYISAGDPRDSIAVTINGTTYLLIANAQISESQPIYKWNTITEKFEFFQNVAIPTVWFNEDYEYYQLNGNHYLSLSNRQGSSYLIKFNGTTWEGIQNNANQLPSVYDTAFVTIGSSSYLAYAHNGGVLIKKFNSTGFVETAPNFYQNISLPGSNAKDIEMFTIGTTTYMAAALSGSSVNIYSWDGTFFSTFQNLSCNTPNSAKFFTLPSGAKFLATAENYNADVNSQIFQWTGTNFVLFQTIYTYGAFDVDTFTMGGETYLIFCSYKSSTLGPYGPTLLYKYNGNLFTKVATISTRSATSARLFSISGNSFIFITNEGTDTNYSVLYKLTF